MEEIPQALPLLHALEPAWTSFLEATLVDTWELGNAPGFTKKR